MSKPASPCRRICSTWHSPENQSLRFDEDKLERIQGGETRIMVLKKSPIRGFTPAPVLPPPKPDYSAIDYNRTHMYEKLLHKKSIKYYKDTKGAFHMGSITD